MATGLLNTREFLAAKLEDIRREKEEAQRLRSALANQLREAERAVLNLVDTERRVGAWLSDLDPKPAEQSALQPTIAEWPRTINTRPERNVTDLAGDFLAAHVGEFTSEQLWRYLVTQQPTLRRETMLSFLSRYTKSGLFVRIAPGRYMVAKPGGEEPVTEEVHAPEAASVIKPTPEIKVLELAESFTVATEASSISIDRLIGHKRDGARAAVEPFNWRNTKMRI